MAQIGRTRSALFLTGAAIAATPVAAIAQDAAEGMSGDIIVTAQRQEQRLQDVPVSVTAFGADQLRESSIETVQDIATRTPGLAITAVDPINTNFAMRGIGSAPGISQNAGGDPSVVVFVDGVYAGRGGTPDLDTLDLERVEVLRGPQGTLFGKNAIGGLVQFVSRKPDDETSFYFDGTYGNYSRVGITARGNLPLSDKIFLSAGVAHKQRDGFEYNETTGNDVNDLNLTTGRLALRFVPTDTLGIILRADVSHQDQKGNPRHNNCDATFDGGIHCVGINPDPRVVDAYIDGQIKRTIQTYSAEVNLDLPFGTLTSLTALRKVTFDFVTPFFSNPVNPPAQIESTSFGDEDDSQFSQELRLSFDAWNGRLKGQTGLYFLKENNDRVEGQIQDFPSPAISGTGIYPQSVNARSFAVFGQVDAEIVPSLTATLGARMTWERKSGRFAGFKVDDGPGVPPPLGSADGYDVTSSKKWNAFTPRFALNWKANDDVLLYASVARGYKSGGYQGISGTAAGASTPYDPEFAWSYEVGAKTDWFDRALRVNLAAFRTDYSDLQISQLVPLCCVVVTNAAKARIKGFEIETVVRPAAWLQLDGSYAYLDAKFTEYAIPGQDYTGNRLPRSPKNKVNVGGQIEAPVGALAAKLRVDYSWVDDAYFEASNIPQQLWPAHQNLDARLSLAGPDDQWELSVWGKNLTDELVPTYVTYFAPYRQILTPYAPPRTYGVTLAFKL
ncbi:TonB-dependent receptor [Sphingopyxis indica]|uniref:TonB-dependent receptor n=1 Tax=Sphingopyxis indica TaxID=436663 RepID=UPI0029391F0E|nr:TonB-dependent receptor [Sphingopyxis indica]WOF42390.1 TonB-dependent receptor [Sphingopyxis indica]